MRRHPVVGRRGHQAHSQHTTCRGSPAPPCSSSACTRSGSPGLAANTGHTRHQSTRSRHDHTEDTSNWGAACPYPCNTANTTRHGSSPTFLCHNPHTSQSHSCCWSCHAEGIAVTLCVGGPDSAASSDARAIGGHLRVISHEENRCPIRSGRSDRYALVTVQV